MKENTIKKPSYTAVITAEYRLLNALVRKPAFIEDARVSEDLFIDEVAKSIYEALYSMKSENIEVTPSSLLQAGSNIDFNVTQQVVQTIFDIDKEGASSLDDIIPVLKTAQTKNIIIDKIDRLKSLLSQPGNINIAEAQTELYSIEEDISNSSKKTSKLLSFSDWAEEYVEDLQQRKAGRKYSYGDPFLDEYFYKGAYPGAITTVAANTSMGKSTYVLSLIDSLLDRDVPCMYISLEMGAIDTMDRLISRRCGISNENLYDTSMENIDGIIEVVRQEQTKLSDRKNFYFCESTDVDLVKLRSLIREFKQKTHADYCFVAIDLLTQMKNFMSASNGSSTATAMEIGMNQLNALAKEENVHILGVVQFKRDSDSVKIHDIDQIEVLRPTLTDIKNSGAIAERSRVVLSVFRKKYYAERYLQNDPDAANLPDIMEVQVLKNSSGASGHIFKYIFDTKHFKLEPLLDEDSIENQEEDRLAQLGVDF